MSQKNKIKQINSKYKACRKPRKEKNTDFQKTTSEEKVEKRD